MRTCGCNNRKIRLAQPSIHGKSPKTVTTDGTVGYGTHLGAVNLLRHRRLGDPASLVPELFRPPRIAEGDRSTQVCEARKLFARGVRSREAAVPRSTQAVHLFRGQPVWKPRPIMASQRGRSDEWSRMAEARSSLEHALALKEASPASRLTEPACFAHSGAASLATRARHRAGAAGRARRRPRG